MDAVTAAHRVWLDGDRRSFRQVLADAVLALLDAPEPEPEPVWRQTGRWRAMAYGRGVGVAAPVFTTDPDVEHEWVCPATGETKWLKAGEKL